MLIVLALLLGVIGIIASWPRPVPPKEPKQVALATRNIPTYTQITQDMVEPRWLFEWTDPRGRTRYFWRKTLAEVKTEKDLTDEVARGDAQEVSKDQATNAVLYSDVIDRMTTRDVSRGAVVSDLSALTVEQVRYVADLNKEIISFPARFDEIVGGQIKPGHRVNVYAFRGELSSGETRRPAEVKLIASNVPVVDVRTRTGDESARLLPTPTGSAARSSGLFGGGGSDSSRRDPGSVVTVAVEPELAALIVDVLGAQGFEAWVSLAGNRAIQVTPTPVPTGTPDAAATATAAAQGTLTAIGRTATAQAAAATGTASVAQATQAARSAAATGTASVPPTDTPTPRVSARPANTPVIPITGGQKPER